MTEAEIIANNLGSINSQLDDDNLKNEIERLRKPSFVELEAVKLLHDWLENKRHSRQCCRVVGESRNGKTLACNAFRLRHKPAQQPGKAPKVPVVYVQPPQECSSRDLFQVIIEHLKYQITKGTVSDIRDRTYNVLKTCQVEMLIIDEADRLKPKTFADVRDIYDHLGIAVVLVGTERLDTVIKKDEQVYNRFRACYNFGTLTGNSLTKVVDIWEKQVLCLPLPSNLTQKSMMQVIVQSTRGYIGLIDMILKEAAIRTLQKGNKKIDLNTLKEVAQEYK